jgi:hypothetical protein
MLLVQPHLCRLLKRGVKCKFASRKEKRLPALRLAEKIGIPVLREALMSQIICKLEHINKITVQTRDPIMM